MKFLFNGRWKFYETDLDATYQTAMERKNEFKPVEVPHDWLIYDSRDLYRDGMGWYTKDFEMEFEGKRVFLTFEGVYMDSEVYVNGHKAFEWKYGYSSFTFEITRFLVEGTNNVTVSARYQNPNTRWYSGAGIYRNVWVNITEDTYLPENGMYISSHKDGNDYIVHIETEVAGPEADTAILNYNLNNVSVRGITSNAVTWMEDESKRTKKVCEVPACDISQKNSSDKRITYVSEYRVSSPSEWDIYTPNLYDINAELIVNGTKADEVTSRVGFKTIKLSMDKGFIINGRNIKLNGVCEHHDLGALGAAYRSAAMERKLKRLKKMGVNAIRGTHNMVAPDVLRLLDEMGMVFISESFDMWEKSKTEYDYARFFKEWHTADVASWVRRDRNHACVAFWSIGNEIYDTHADDNGQRITRDLKSLVEQHDPYGNAVPTIGSNYMPWENARKCADILKVAGYNYAEKYYKEHHEEHPDWIIYGSETASVVQSRGIYHFPATASILSDDDEQCSSLGNSQTSWGAKSIEDCIADDRDTPFSMGQFLWTGFDYIGEPTPYHTKNSYFGQIDTAGFPKDAYYVLQAAWTDYKESPMVHICPHWDFNEGQTIDIKVSTNAPEAELWINGKSLGRHEFTNRPGTGKQMVWNLTAAYEPGELKAVAYDENGSVIAEDIVRTNGDSAKIVLEIEKAEIKADGRDLAFVAISTVDADGNPVVNAQDRVTVKVSGAGRLVGLDNGDSSDLDSYKSCSRRLFSGKLLAIIESDTVAGDINVSVAAKGLETAECTITAVPAESMINSYEPVECIEKCLDRELVLGSETEVPIRKIELCRVEGSRVLSPECKEAVVEARIYPVNASYDDIVFQAVTEYGVDTNIASFEKIDNNKIKVTAKGDGSFYIRALSKNGADKTRIITYLDFENQGLGAAFLNPYEFVSGSLYSEVIGEAGNGNDKGVATARGEKTVITYNDLDFGRDSGDEITIPVFALDGGEAVNFKIWSGDELLAEEVYQKPAMWNVYQEVTWKLSRRLTGVNSLSFELYSKVHIKGFIFKKNVRALDVLIAVDNDEIYGDTFTKGEDAITGIGNNVSLVFKDMDFGDDGVSSVMINGRANGGVNTMHILFEQNGTTVRRIIEIPESADYQNNRYEIEKLTGEGTVTFVFLPGSNFDFKDFQFCR